MTEGIITTQTLTPASKSPASHSRRYCRRTARPGKYRCKVVCGVSAMVRKSSSSSSSCSARPEEESRTKSKMEQDFSCGQKMTHVLPDERFCLRQGFRCADVQEWRFGHHRLQPHPARQPYGKDVVFQAERRPVGKFLEQRMAQQVDAAIDDAAAGLLFLEAQQCARGADSKRAVARLSGYKAANDHAGIRGIGQLSRSRSQIGKRERVAVHHQPRGRLIARSPSGVEKATAGSQGFCLGNATNGHAGNEVGLKVLLHHLS